MYSKHIVLFKEIVVFKCRVKIVFREIYLLTNIDVLVNGTR